MNNIFEKFNFDISIYQEYKFKQQQIVDYFDNRVSYIDKQKNANKNKIDKIEKNSVINILFIILIFFVLAILISYSLFMLSYEKYTLFVVGGFIFINILLFYIINFIYRFEYNIRNILTIGKYKKAIKKVELAEEKIDKLTTQKEKSLEKLEKDVILQVSPFEEEFYDYYTQELEDFYQTKLYRKRTSGERFYEDLLEFESMINDLEKVNDIFLTQKFYLQEYTDYVNKRKFDVEFQDIFNEEKDKKPKVNYKDEKAKELNEFVNDITQVKQVKSPENKFRQPQKVNWDKVNQKNKETGLKGEELVLEMERKYLQSIGKDDLAQKIRHVSVVDGDGAGYDILSYFDDGREKYIEVKSTTQSIDTQYFLSKNELDFLNSNKDDAFIYRVSFINEESIMLQVLSVKDIVEKYDLSPMQYSVKLKEK